MVYVYLYSSSLFSKAVIIVESCKKSGDELCGLIGNCGSAANFVSDRGTFVR